MQRAREAFTFSGKPTPSHASLPSAAGQRHVKLGSEGYMLCTALWSVPPKKVEQPFLMGSPVLLTSPRPHLPTQATTYPASRSTCRKVVSFCASGRFAPAVSWLPRIVAWPVCLPVMKVPREGAHTGAPA